MNPNGSTSWKTKEDVLQDLDVIGQAKITDNYLVIGNRPPPPLKDDVDDEYDLRFGGTTYSDATAPPDLVGISAFLRMLKEDDPEEDNTLQKNEVLVVSKLNPLSKEFVPKVAKKTSPRKSLKSSNYLEKNNLHLKSPLNSPKFSESLSSKNSTEGTVNDQNEVAKESQSQDNVRPKDIAEETNSLREKISETLKSDSPIHKKQRNAAIANLLKLHSAKPSPASSITNVSPSAGEKKLNLCTPDYFKTLKNKVEPKESEIEKDATAKDEFMDANIKESIEKVNNWLEPKIPEPKSPATVTKPTAPVYLGPVSFKRKVPNGKTPTIETKVAVQKSNVLSKAFIPSEYAMDLVRQYEESKEDDRRQLTIWDKLKKELKKKDEEKRKKQAANSLA